MHRAKLSSLCIPKTNWLISLLQFLIQGGFCSLADILVLEGLLEGSLILVRERGLVDGAAEFGHLGYNFVSGGFYNQDEKSCASGLDFLERLGEPTLPF